MLLPQRVNMYICFVSLLFSMLKKQGILFILFILVSHFVLFSQNQGAGTLTMEGLVYGYNYNPLKKLLKKDKQLKIEGVLEGVTLKLVESGKELNTRETNGNGVFSLKLKTGKVYTLQLSKSGYANISMVIDLANVSQEVTDKGLYFKGAELILNTFQPKEFGQTSPVFGTLFYDQQTKCLQFKPQKNISKTAKEYFSNPVSLMLRSVEKNKQNPSTMPSESAEAPSKQLSENNKATLTSSQALSAETSVQQYSSKKNATPYDSLATSILLFKKKALNDPAVINTEDIQSLEEKIAAARKKIEQDKQNVQSPEDSLALAEATSLLDNLEIELQSARKTIELQQEKISTQKQMLMLAFACVLLLSVLLVMIYRYNKEKKKTYLLLKDKNKKITDSINYALKIQESVLPDKEEVSLLFPRSFVFFKPRDVVSGDFYWISAIKDKKIIACIDCTGHGVPGAFMSLIGNTLLNEIVNEKEIIDPALILKNLHLQLLKILHQESSKAQSKDGMEGVVCVIDESKNEILFAGAMNPAYVVKQKEIVVIKPDIRGIGGDTNLNKDAEFTMQKITIEKGMNLYLFTDGYMDQFGGSENKKYNIPNFKKLLQEIQGKNMEQQRVAIDESISSWKGKERQIDDMLVIGIGF